MNRSFSSITLLFLHGMRSFVLALACWLQCQGCARSVLSGMCPVCTQPKTPPPIDVLLQTKGKLQLDRTVTERSRPAFRIFQRSDLAQFQPCFVAFTVRAAEGRNL